ncbi:MAG: LPS export ABC transporter periplasmic protein LptC [Kiritimatiellae bacterium]|nr:LPS export ABC transporter periplasmic protein LptC [Kiritimatiellia bacterium]
MTLYRSLLALVMCCAIAGAQDFEVEDLRVPLEHFPDGTVKTEVTAKRAKVSDTGALIASGLKVEFRNPDGSVHTTLKSKVCVFDRVNKRADSDDDVELIKDGIKITGTGFVWTSDDERIKIKNNVEVTLEKKNLGFDFSILR